MAISGVSAWADFGARLLNASGPKVEYNLGSAEAKKKKKSVMRYYSLSHICKKKNSRGSVKVLFLVHQSGELSNCPHCLSAFRAPREAGGYEIVPEKPESFTYLWERFSLTAQ